MIIKLFIFIFGIVYTPITNKESIVFLHFFGGFELFLEIVLLIMLILYIIFRRRLDLF